MTLQSPNNHPAPEPVKPRRFSIIGVIEKIFIIGAILAIFGVIGGFGLIVSPGQQPAKTTIVIPRGSSVTTIAELLANKGIITYPTLFRIGSRVIAMNNLKAGEYEIEPGQSMAEIILMMFAGDSVVRSFTLVEGTTSGALFATIKADTSFSGPLDFPPAEGSLLPDTYNYSFEDNRAEFIKRMQTPLTKFLEEAWKDRDVDVPLTSPDQAMIMASMIEKETGKTDERARIAGVFYNRLKQHMRLQSDPTVVYAIEKERGPLGRALTRDDLTFASPINTYASDGLPPQPICNPGKAAIIAALHPEKNNLLYFVADGAGGHRFAATLDEHNKNVAMYRSNQ